MGRYSMFLGRKNQYCEIDYTTKCNLQIQVWSLSNYQWHFFTELGKKFHNSYGNTKTLNSQSNLEKEEWSWRNQHSWLQIILQSYSYQDSMVLAQKQKYRPMDGEGNGTPLQYSCLENPMDGGAWWAAVHGVAKSRTRLSNFIFTFMNWRRKWQPTPVFLPGESQGRGSLVGCRLWDHTESDMSEAT